jgi:F0F1-type ATP synthase membrane subunit b/b'
MTDSSDFSKDNNERSGKTVAVIAIMIVLAVTSGYLMWRVSNLTGDLTSTRADVAQMNSAAAANAATESETVRALRADLEAARSEASESAVKARSEARKLTKQVATQVAADQQKAQQLIDGELTEVKQSASSAHEKISGVTQEVAAAKTQLESTTTQANQTATDLKQTVSDLKSMTGDMGVMSGKIATNATELAALRTLGERNYFEFTIDKTKTPQKVGDIQLVLKRTDPKRSKYTVEVQADDKLVEKRDKTANEPVQFYLAKARQPYEIVVNEVSKGKITGYLSTPKVHMARN